MNPVDYDSITDSEYESMPLIVEGESKIVRAIPDAPGLALIRLKPTIYSFTANRAGVVAGSDTLRLRATRILTDVLRRAGIAHAYHYVGERFIVSDHIERPPPIEVVVKAFHTGTSKHRYAGMSDVSVRRSHPLYAGFHFEADGAYPVPVVRFDWRNPLRDASGKTMADEVLGDETANWFIDVTVARLTALRAFKALSDFLGLRDIVLCDVCFFISEDGRTMFGEISQDCGRFRHFDLGSLDKDVWRAGGSSSDVLAKWDLLTQMIAAPPMRGGE